MRMVSPAPQKPRSPVVRFTPQERGQRVQCVIMIEFTSQEISIAQKALVFQW